MSRARAPEDYLVTDTLHKYPDNGGITLAVGDVTRLQRFVEHPNGLHTPVITGGFVDRMCLWLLDSPDPRVRSLGEDVLILSHPRHMTSYHVAAFELMERLGDRSPEVQRRIRSVVPPGQEHNYYSTWSNALRVVGRRVAYMSSDIMSVTETTKRKRHIVLDFANDDRFQNVSMTGFFTSDSKYRAEKTLIDEFQGRISRAIDALYSGHDQVPWELSRNKSLLQEAGFHPHYAQLCKLAEKLTQIDGYATDLALSAAQIDKSVRIRTRSNPSVDAAALARALSGFIAADVPVPTDGPLILPSTPINERVLIEERYELRLKVTELSEPRTIFEADHWFYPWIARLIYLGATIMSFGLFYFPQLFASTQPAVDNTVPCGSSSEHLASCSSFGVSATDHSSHRWRQIHPDAI